MPTPAICRLLLWVHDCAALADFYTTTFGWTISVDEREDQWIELDAGGFCLALHGGNTGPTKQRWPKFQIRVDDVASMHARLSASGIPMSGIQTWKSLTWAEGQDPEGHVFQISNR